MPHQPTSESPQVTGQIAGGRYELIGLIGRGGMADVFEARDQLNGQTVALKRLREVEDDERRQRSGELFEREFHVLSQLAHPRVVKVFDYGLDGELPFYTMEVLHGGDLRDRSPMPWQAACAAARDVCSVLSLLHSRRLVYRDLSPRNVRLSLDDQAKVIDFGAMTPMGPSRQLVGTAAFCAPESVQLQALDGRTDLYALGATLYYVLCGRPAYPAADFRHLHVLWQQRPKRPSELGVELPEPLVALVMELMELDPTLRPSTAGEVMERLTAIAGLPDDEQLLVSRAYLTTPSLVGREQELQRIGKRLAAARFGQGGATIVRGESGSGRSRLLDATALEAKLSGATVLRADAIDAQSDDYGVARALGSQLLDAQPEVAIAAASPHLPVLGHLLPALLAGRDDVTLQTFADSTALRPALQAALREWFTAVARERLIALVVDDFDLIDEPSAAFVALLAREAASCKLMVCVSTRQSREQPSAALKLLAESSAMISLRKLDGEQTEELLRSVFGDVPHVQVLSSSLHDLAEGNPRDVLQLAQHLVDRGLLRYHAGVWALPASIDPGELPASMAQALDARVASLPPAARELAQGMALGPELRFSLTECSWLVDERDQGKALAALDALLTGGIVKGAGESYGLAQEGLVAAVLRTCTREDASRLQRRLARIFDARGEQMRAAIALIDSGAEHEGIELLVKAAEQSEKDTNADAAVYARVVRSLPADWWRWFEVGLALCAMHGRSPRDAFVLKSRQVSLAQSSITPKVAALLKELLAEQAVYAGVDLEAQVDPTLPPEARLKLVLERAQARHDALPAELRVLAPVAAIGKLASTIVLACGAVSTVHDHELLAAIPSIALYAPLSPMLAMIEQLVTGVRARLTGRFEEAADGYRIQFERLSRPDGGGLEASYAKHTRLGVLAGLAVLEASAGRSEGLAYAAELEAEPAYGLNAWNTRSLYYAWRGHAAEVDRCRQRVELLRIQNGPRQYLQHGHVLPELAAYAAAGDLTRVKQSLPLIESLSRDFPGWLPIAHYARGEYHRLRGDLTAALGELEEGLALTRAGGHAAWILLAGGALTTLQAMGRDEEVVARGEAYLTDALANRQGYMASFIRVPLAQALAQLGRFEPAVALADATIAELIALGSSGIQLGLAYEARARVAARARDTAGFDRFARLCAEQYRLSESRTLSRRYERMLTDAKGSKLAVGDELLSAGDYSHASSTGMGSHITSVMEGCKGPAERSRRCLDLLVKHSRSAGGHLFLLADRQPQIAAERGERDLPGHIELQTRELLASLMRAEDDDDSHTMSETASDEGDSSQAADWTGDSGEQYRTCMLVHEEKTGRAIVGAAVLRVDPDSSFVMPHDLAVELSRFLFASGDVSAFIAGA
jgi:hypothetical protein